MSLLSPLSRPSPTRPFLSVAVIFVHACARTFCSFFTSNRIDRLPALRKEDVIKFFFFCFLLLVSFELLAGYIELFREPNLHKKRFSS